MGYGVTRCREHGLWIKRGRSPGLRTITSIPLNQQFFIKHNRYLYRYQNALQHNLSEPLVHTSTTNHPPPHKQINTNTTQRPRVRHPPNKTTNLPSLNPLHNSLRNHNHQNPAHNNTPLPLLSLLQHPRRHPRSMVQLQFQHPDLHAARLSPDPDYHSAVYY